MAADMESRVRGAAREILNGLRNADNSQSKVKWLHAAKCLVKFEGTGLPKVLQHYDDVPFPQLCSLFRERHFTSFCCTVLDLMTFEWLQSLPANCFNENVEILFLSGPAAESLMVLERAVQKSRQGFKLQKTTILLETFLKKGRMVQVIWEQCQVDPSSQGQDFGTSLSSHGSLCEELVTTIASLPSRMANRLGRETSDVFLPQNYVPSLANCILQCLQKAHALFAESKECSLDFISRLVGKLCFTGSADGLMGVLVPVLCSSVTADSTWCPVSQRVFMGVPLLTMESVIVPLLTRVPWYKWLAKVLGEDAVSNERVRFLLCTKLLFHRYFSQEIILQNLIGYLASSPVRRAMYREVFANLLRVWGDASNLRLVPQEQHLFLCRALMVCISHLQQQDPSSWTQEMIQLLLPGVQGHLASSDVSMRSRGMLVAQVLTRTLDPNGPQVEFEIPPSPEIEELEKLLVVPPDPGLAPIKKAVESLHLPNSSAEAEKEGASSPHDAEELDSDDDLVPCDMSFDKKMTMIKAPKYLRDCMEGLLDTQAVDKFEVSLQTAESLITNQPDGLREISAEFAMILLHNTENCGIEDFVALRMRAMVALAVQCPKEVAEYLTSQFYERNYNIRQRLDILEVLTTAAQKLSEPNKPGTKATTQRTFPEEVQFDSPRPETWRDVVQRRIDSKTRRFGKGRTQPEPVAIANRFGSVAGEFFYPLMTFYDRGEGFFDVLGDDSLVLNRLVYSLAIILHAAVNTTAARQMGKTLLEFTWGLRNHHDITVQQAVLVATTIVVLVVPTHCLMTDLSIDIMETKVWLEEVADRGVNEQCRELAVQSLRLLEATMAKEMQESAASQ